MSFLSFLCGGEQKLLANFSRCDRIGFALFSVIVGAPDITILHEVPDMFKCLQVAVLVGCVLALAGAAHANLITHDGVTVFEETFENQVVGEPPVGGPPVNVTPITPLISPGPGGWEFGYGGAFGETVTTLDSSTQVVEAPAPFEGNQFMEVRRFDDGGIYAGRDVGSDFVDGLIHAEMMVYQTANVQNQGSVHFNASPTTFSEGTGGDALFHVYSFTGDRVLIYTTPPAFGAGHFLMKQSGGILEYELETWQKWEFDIDLDNKNFAVTINGERSLTEPFITGNENNALRFFGTRAQFGSLAYFDATDPNVATPTSFEWLGATPGKWSSSLNWSPSGGPPNGADVDATFGSMGTGGTVSTDQPVTLNKIIFDSSNAYFIAGGGSIDLAQDPSGPTDPTIDVVSGSHEFQVQVNLGANTSVDSGGGTLDFNNQIDLAGNTLTTTGNVNLNHSVIDSVGGGSISSSGMLSADGSVAIAGELISTGTLEITAGSGQVDVFHVAGAASLEGTVDVDVLGPFTPTSDITILTTTGGINLTGPLSLGGPDAGMFPGGVQVVGNDLVLSVPEPASLVLVLLACVTCFFHARHGRSRQHSQPFLIR